MPSHRYRKSRFPKELNVLRQSACGDVLRSRRGGGVAADLDDGEGVVAVCVAALDSRLAGMSGESDMHASLYLRTGRRKRARLEPAPVQSNGLHKACCQRKGAWAASSALPTSGRHSQVFNPDPFSKLVDGNSTTMLPANDRMYWLGAYPDECLTTRI